MALPMVASSALEQLIGVERLAFLREVTLMPRDLGAVVPRVRAGDDVVVLVHGFLASAGVFRPLRARLERESTARIATFSHAPGVGIRRIARRLAEIVDGFPTGVRTTIVGHSLGGIVARWYVQEMGGHARVVRTVSLATPFGGVDVPPLLVGADLHEQSTLLQRVRDRAALFAVPHTSIVAGDDTVVVGRETACLGHGDVFVAEGCGHAAVLFDPEVARVVLDRVRASTEKPGDGRRRAW